MSEANLSETMDFESFNLLSPSQEDKLLNDDISINEKEFKEDSSANNANDRQPVLEKQ